VATDSVGQSAQLFRCDEVHLVPATSEPERFIDAIERLVDTIEPDLVIPGSDPDVSAIADLAARRPDRNRFLVGDAACARIIEDKLVSWQFASNAGLPFVDTICTDDPARHDLARDMAERWGYPLVSKPRFGSASRGVSLLLNDAHLEAALGVEGQVIQQFRGEPANAETVAAFLAIPGVPLWFDLLPEGLFGCQALINSDGQVGPIATMKLTQRAGRLWGMETLDDPEIRDLGHAFAELFSANGWRGLINIQGGYDERGASAFEFNGRFNGGTSARLSLGFDEVGWTINSLIGSEVIPPYGGTTGTRAERSFTDYPGRDDDVDHLRREGSWTVN